VRALETCMPRSIGRPSRPFLMYLRPMAHRTPQGMRWQHRSPPDREAGSRAVGHTSLQSPPLQGGRIRSCRTRGAPEPSPTGRQGLELGYTWRRRSPSYQGCKIRSHWTHGSPGAHLAWEAMFGATGHVVAHGCTPRSLS
jgi:hypothetical protein